MADVIGSPEPPPTQAAVGTILYILYFAPLIWVLAEYQQYPVAAPATVLGITLAHFAAGLLENWPQVAAAARNRYLGKSMWLNIVADLLITSSATLAAVAVASTDGDNRVTLAAAITATIGNVACVAGRIYEATL